MHSAVSLLPCLVVLLVKAENIAFNVTPTPKVCEEGPLPSNFSITCTVNDNSAVLSWVVTGTTTPLGGPIGGGYDLQPFKYPMRTSPGEATLYVQDPSNSEVVIGTCFQCRATVGHKPTDSKKQCLFAVGQPMAPGEVTLTGRTVSWSQSSPEFSYNITVCREGTSDCPYNTRCPGCTFTNIDGEVEDGSYNISVCSSSMANRKPCMSEACASTVTVLSTPPGPAPTSEKPLGPALSSPTRPARTPRIAFSAVPVNVPAIVGGTVGGLIALGALVVIIIIVVAVVIKQKNVKKDEFTEHTSGTSRVDVHGDTTYAAPDKSKAATEGGDGVLSYAATPTVVPRLRKPGGGTKATENVYVQPEKVKRGSKKQPPLSDVPHKQGPIGDLYTMPDKKALEVEHKAGPQGDMYAMTAKPSEGGYGAEGPTNQYHQRGVE